MSNIKPHKIKQIVGKKIRIGNDVILTIIKVSQPGERMQVEFGVEAPKSVPITLLEFYSERVNAMKKEIASLKNTTKQIEKTKLTIKKSWLRPKHEISNNSQIKQKKGENND